MKSSFSLRRLGVSSLNENLVFVITDTTITGVDFAQQVRYGDLLVKTEGGWKFQTMAQGGWGEHKSLIGRDELLTRKRLRDGNG